ncbi:hypothetical protein A7U60_g1252 [Sanghuangporus baumii]|uniref:DUF4218 domain-containing protein n=1 Tax=Sanghuangporus baumii TaxID=108892 RepID=A0A9Q5I5E7_SANBA|nr:hypothetical protein A7U60_g1252 [Sanghuangporus baumii]
MYADVLTVWRFQRPLNSVIKLTTTGLMNHIQHVISTTTAPSFVRPVPTNFGDPAAGKIKADEWRTLCTIHLPLALISYCFYSSDIRDAVFRQRFAEVIDHTMDLVQAVAVLFKKSIGPNEIGKYRSHIGRYISRLQQVHPEANFVPNMHMAMHIADYLPLFGSIYSWWTFPFERLIGKLRDMQTNSKTGQFEATLLHTFLATSRLRQQFSRDNCPPSVEECLAVINQVFDQNAGPASGRISDGRIALPGDLVESPEVMSVLEEYSDRIRSRCKWNHVQYHVRSRHAGNSQIVFCPKDADFLIPGHIEYITVGDKPIFIVRRLTQASTDEEPFVQFKDVRMGVFHYDSSQPLEVVECEAVAGHFVAFNLMNSYYACVSLA